MSKHDIPSPTIEAYKASDFRQWLKRHHRKEKRVEVVLHKRHTGKDAPTHRELIEEAICFGWIDTTIKRLDEDRYIRNFSKRTEKSSWSENTLRYAKELVREGRMQAEGLKYYKLGLKKPVHDAGIPKNPVMPKELRDAFVKKKNTRAKALFDSFPPSTKKMLYRWVLSGKRESTRDRRVQKIIEGAKIGKQNMILKGD